MVDISKTIDGAKRPGLRRDGDPSITNAIRHIRGSQSSAGVPVADKPGILALDYNGGSAADNYIVLWAAKIAGSVAHLRFSAANQDPDALNEDSSGVPLVRSDNGTTLIRIKHLVGTSGANASGTGNTLAHGLATALAVFTQVQTDGAAPAATDTVFCNSKINGANIEYDCFKADGVTASTTSMGIIDFLVVGI